MTLSDITTELGLDPNAFHESVGAGYNGYEGYGIWLVDLEFTDDSGGATNQILVITSNRHTLPDVHACYGRDKKVYSISMIEEISGLPFWDSITPDFMVFQQVRDKSDTTEGAKS